MKGSTPFYYALSVVGLISAAWLAWEGFNGHPLSSLGALALGSFFIVKEILDMLH